MTTNEPNWFDRATEPSEGGWQFLGALISIAAVVGGIAWFLAALV